MMSKAVSLTYTIIVMGPIYGTQQAYLAYQFVQSLLKTSHHIQQLFFYADGVYNANPYVCPASDEFNLLEAWINLAEAHHIPLEVCVSAGLRRGILREANVDTVARPFISSGLTSLGEAIASSDRVIQF